MKEGADLVIDLGSGTGVIPLILCHKTKASQIWGVEIQESSLERAARSARLNDVSDRVSFILGDVKDVKTTWGRDFKGRAGAVVSNPPYFKAGGAIRSWQGAKAAARHETTAGLEDFMECTASCHHAGHAAGVRVRADGFEYVLQYDEGAASRDSP